MRIIAGNTHLHTLNLSRTCVTSDGLALLCFNPHLSRLELNQCNQLEQTIPALRSLCNLQHVSLSQSRSVSPCHIISALRNATKITYLDLSWCQGAAGSTRRALLTLPQLQQLHVLSLDNARLPVELFTCVLLLPKISRLGACGYAFPSASDIPFALLTTIFRVPIASTAQDQARPRGCEPGRLTRTSTSALEAAVAASTGSVVSAAGAKAVTVAATPNAIGLMGTESASVPENHFDGPAAPMRMPALLLPRLHGLTSLRLRWANVRILPLLAFLFLNERILCLIYNALITHAG